MAKGFGLTLNAAKSNFFDRPAVIAAVGRATATALSKGGAEVRKLAQRSILMRERPSSPGQPPHGHRTGTRTRKSKSTGRVRVQAVSPLREFLFFSFDPQTESVVVGPVKLSQALSGTAPMALEYGGSSVVVSYRNGRRVQRRVSIRARPFMRPALQAAMPVILEAFRNSVK